MRANYSAALRNLVRRKPSPARMLAEVVEVVGSEVKVTQTDWDGGTATVGSIETLESGGARIAPGTSAAISGPTNDGTEVTTLNQFVPFDGLHITWEDVGAEMRELRTFVARLDARENAGNPKTCAWFVCEVYRVVGIGVGDELEVQLLKSTRLAESGDADADYTFDFAGSFGQYPVVGAGLPGQQPQTIIRIYALQADGTQADNVAWLADSVSGASITDSSTYTAEHRSYTAASGGQSGGALWTNAGTVANMFDFTLNRPSFSGATIEFAGGAAIPDIAGAGDFVVRVRGETPGDSALNAAIDDGGGYVSCFDGDKIGADNTPTGGADLSGVSTTGPWNMDIDLVPATGGLQSPTIREVGVELENAILLPRVAELVGGSRQVEPLSLVGNIPDARVHIYKTGERDYRDYGSEILATNHIGDVQVRVWVADDGAGTHLDRKDWMLHSEWDIDDYVNRAAYHELLVVSPIRRFKVAVPPFVVTSGNDGTRAPVEVTGTLKAAYDEIVDTLVGAPTRLVGPGIEDAVNTCGKWIRKSDAKTELDAVAYLAGYAVIESQGRIKAVPMMRDTPGADAPEVLFPLGSYTPVGLEIGPGYSTRTDEFFVLWDYDDGRDDFDSESRYLNAAALENLGGVGLNTLQELDVEIGKWITTEALADLVGKRFVNHFAMGLMLWEIIAHERSPHLEPGDPVGITTDRYVGRSPINGQAIRGPVSPIAIVQRVHDPWGQHLTLWVPSLEAIVVEQGVVSRFSNAAFNVGAALSIDVDPVSGEPRVNYLAPAATGELYPDGQTSATNYPASNVHLDIDATTPFDSTSTAQSVDTTDVWPANRVSDFLVTLGNPGTTPSGGEVVTLQVRAQMVEVSGTGHTANARWELRQGSTVIVSGSQAGLTTAWTQFDIVLNSVQRASITDWNDLNFFWEVTEGVASGGDAMHTKVSLARVAFS